MLSHVSQLLLRGVLKTTDINASSVSRFCGLDLFSPAPVSDTRVLWYERQVKRNRGDHH